MSVELRSIRCHHFRVTREPCLNPAVVEVLGPAPHLLCAEHAAAELGNTAPGWAHLEGWEEFGAEEYARHCEQAMNALEEWSRVDGARARYPDNPVLTHVLEEADHLPARLRAEEGAPGPGGAGRPEGADAPGAGRAGAHRALGGSGGMRTTKKATRCRRFKSFQAHSRIIRGAQRCVLACGPEPH